MEQQQWEKINRIVDTALDLDREERSTYVKKKCEEQEVLQSNVFELLDSIEESETEQFLEGTQAYPQHLARDLSHSDHVRNSSAMIGEMVGRYKMVEPLGHGGMGSVFKAIRTDQAYDKPIAVKILRRGMDTPSNISRFRRERNILAKLDHPNIARLLDGGITDNGLPYLVMEYVDGIPLHKYCEKHQLSVTRRLSLFEEVCKAVQHAQNNAIIHRDLKPSNILVTDSGAVKVLDFGIAKLLDPDPEDSQFQTQTGDRLLTLGYAAPEQLNAKPITAATDVYVLGILLYELLSGVSPLEVKSNNITEIEEAIRTETPDKPSDRVASIPSPKKKQVAGDRDCTPKALQRQLNGDIDAIVMKALRKEPQSRYRSADQLLDDLYRRNNDLPVIAHEDTFRYNFRKFIKRYRTGISIAVGFVLLVTSFVTFYTIKISEERDRAQIEAQRAEAVTGFLTDLIQSNYPENAKGDTITVRQFLNEGYQNVQELEQTPLVKAEIMKIIGHTYRSLGQPQKAQTMISGAVDLLAEHEARPLEQAKAYNTAGLILRDLGQTKQAAENLQKSVQLFANTEQSQTPEMAKALRDLAYVERSIKNFDDAEHHVKQAIAINKQQNPSSAQLAESYYVYASILRIQQRHEEALNYQLKSFTILEENIEGPHPGKSANLNNLAMLYTQTDSLEQAIRSYKQSLAMNKKLYGPSHFRVANNANNIAKQYERLGKADSALAYNTQSLQILRDNVAEDHTIWLRALNTQANILSAKKEYETADSLYKEALNIADSQNSAHSTMIGNIHMSWGANDIKQQDLQAALPHYQKALTLRKTNFGIEDARTQESLKRMIQLLHKTGNFQKADSLSKYIIDQ